MSKAFRDYLKDNGIHIHQSMPYAHKQNGCAEQLIQTLMDKAQAMHLHACLPDSYWEFAIVKTGSTPMNSGVRSYFNGRTLASLYVVCPCR